MTIITYRKAFFWIIGLITTVAISAIVVYGLPLGIDFTGGSMMQVNYPNGRPALSTVKENVSVVSLGEVSVREMGATAVSIRTRTQTPEEHQAVLTALSQSASTTELSYTSVGPALGAQFANKALLAILAVAFAIILYIAFAFRKVPKPVPGWGYGIVIIAILVHDLIIPAGFFAVLAHFTSAEVDALFVTALLALLGYSVNDTIVIFDRVREHLIFNDKTNNKESFELTVGKSISETLTRSINTSFTVVLALTALVLFGAQATRDFSLVMLVGVIAGTYSSILLAAPLLIPFARWFSKK